jgi:DNA helicase-2/ATP-dependent DNA helicase PcrA
MIQDDFSMQRIINTPKRGIGKVSISKIANEAKRLNKSMYNYLSESSINDIGAIIGVKNTTKIKSFIADIEALGSIVHNDIENFIDSFEDRFLIKEYYNSTPDGYDRVANINEFYEYFKDSLDKDTNMLEFMNDIALQSDQDKIEGECIYLMSIHASKGLEFDNVFLVGLEDGVFPIIGDDVDLEEERRLAYVAITRAKKRLFLCHSASRLYRGRYTNLSKSMFLSNMDNKSENKPQMKMSFSANISTNTFKIGDIAKHKIFGMGKVEKVVKINTQQRLSINFGGTNREILSSYVEKL